MRQAEDTGAPTERKTTEPATSSPASSGKQSAGGLTGSTGTSSGKSFRRHFDHTADGIGRRDKDGDGVTDEAYSLATGKTLYKRTDPTAVPKWALIAAGVYAAGMLYLIATKRGRHA